VREERRERESETRAEHAQQEKLAWDGLSELDQAGESNETMMTVTGVANVLLSQTRQESVFFL
jgi:hypothetical protein